MSLTTEPKQKYTGIKYNPAYNSTLQLVNGAVRVGHGVVTTYVGLFEYVHRTRNV